MPGSRNLFAAGRSPATGRRFLHTIPAADYLGLSPRTLEKLRILGGGPMYHKLGRRVVYAIEDIDQWAAARRRASTSFHDDGQWPPGPENSHRPVRGRGGALPH